MKDLGPILEDLHTRCRQVAIDALQSRYPSVDAELIVDEAILATGREIAGGKAISSPCSYVRTASMNRANNASRRIVNREREILEFDAMAASSPDPAKAEYRRRQGITLGDIYREYVAFCETGGSDKILRRCIREQDLWGRENAEIAGWLNVHVDTVYYHRNRDKVWWLKRLQANDVHRTVFQTMWPANQEAGSTDLPSPATIRSLEFTEKQPLFRTFVELHSWIAFETDAFCPSAERLSQYLTATDKSFFPDVRFHIEERDRMGVTCLFCKNNIASELVE